MARLRAGWWAGVAAVLAVCGPLYGEPPGEPEKFIEHLRLLGYTAAIDGSTLKVTHDGSPVNFRMKAFKGGALQVAGFGIAPAALKDGPSQDLLAFVNDLNKEAWVARFYYDKSDSTLTIEAWYGGAYDRERFGQFFTNWKADTEDMLSRNADQARKLLQ